MLDLVLNSFSKQRQEMSQQDLSFLFANYPKYKKRRFVLMFLIGSRRSNEILQIIRYLFQEEQQEGKDKQNLCFKQNSKRSLDFKALQFV